MNCITSLIIFVFFCFLADNVSSKDIQNIIVCESIIDTLSLYELDEYKSENTLLCSTNGQVSPNHFAVLDFLAQNSKATLILGFDNDKKGKDFTLKTKEALKAYKIILWVLRGCPPLMMAFRLWLNAFFKD